MLFHTATMVNPLSSLYPLIASLIFFLVFRIVSQWKEKIQHRPLRVGREKASNCFERHGKTLTVRSCHPT
jgi:hypothetical protein